MTAATIAAPRHIEVNGHRIRFRLAQQAGWSAISAVLAAALIAGVYFLVFEVNWHVHIGAVRFQIFYLKNWWDGGMGFIHSPSWGNVYRHGLRNLWETVLAALFVKSLLAAKWRKDDVRVGGLRLILTPLLLAVVATALVVGGIWLLDFGLPSAWHHFFGTHRAANPVHLPHSLAFLANFLSTWNWQVVLVGAVIGQIVHKIWAPVGNTIQGFFIDRAAANARRYVNPVGGPGYAPLWVRYPLTPPVARERFAWIMESGQPIRSHGKLDRGLIITFSVVAFWLIVAGLIARYWVATGHTFPYLAP